MLNPIHYSDRIRSKECHIWCYKIAHSPVFHSLSIIALTLIISSSLIFTIVLALLNGNKSIVFGALPALVLKNAGHTIAFLDQCLGSISGRFVPIVGIIVNLLVFIRTKKDWSYDGRISLIMARFFLYLLHVLSVSFFF